jgi:hypothetical protein
VLRTPAKARVPMRNWRRPVQYYYYQSLAMLRQLQAGVNSKQRRLYVALVLLAAAVLFSQVLNVYLNVVFQAHIITEPRSIHGSLYTIR